MKGNSITKLPGTFCDINDAYDLFAKQRPPLLVHADERYVHGNRSLAWLGLETLPDCISNFTYLQSLTLDGNKLTSLPVLNARSLETLFANSTQANNTNTGNNIRPITGAWQTTSLKHSKLAAL